MKKMFFWMLLFLAAAGSMRGQEPQMVVTGNMVNVGALNAAIPIDLRTNADGAVSRIDNKAGGDIKTPALNVSAGTLLNNEGDICVGCAPVYIPIIVPNAAKDYSDSEKGDVAKEWTNVVNDAIIMGTAYDTNPASTMIEAGDLMLSHFVYITNNSVLSKSPGTGSYANADADLSSLNNGIRWRNAVMKCANLTEGGYSDWYLPNIGEMKALGEAGYLGWADIKSRSAIIYRSSTEYTIGNEWCQLFTKLGTGQNYTPKSSYYSSSTTWLARCVRRI